MKFSLEDNGYIEIKKDFMWVGVILKTEKEYRKLYVTLDGKEITDLATIDKNLDIIFLNQSLILLFNKIFDTLFNSNLSFIIENNKLVSRNNNTFIFIDKTCKKCNQIIHPLKNLCDGCMNV